MLLQGEPLPCSAGGTAGRGVGLASSAFADIHAVAAPSTQTVAINGTAAQFDGSDSYTDEEMPVTDWAWNLENSIMSPMYRVRWLVLFLVFGVLGCQQQGMSTEGSIEPGPDIRTRFSSVVTNASDWQEALAASRDFLASLDDAGQLLDLVLFCGTEAMRHESKGDQLGTEYFKRYDLAWTSCQYRLAELGRDGNADALRGLAHLLMDEQYQSGQLSMIAGIISEVGEKAVPYLEEVTGPRAFIARDIIECINRGDLRW